MKKKILVTGSNGFIGRHLLNQKIDNARLDTVSLRSVTPSEIVLERYDTIIHLAGKAHQMKPIDNAIYFEVNYKLTIALATLAKSKGGTHFIFISSIKVYGDSLEDRLLDDTSICEPTGGTNIFPRSE